MLYGDVDVDVFLLYFVVEFLVGGDVCLCGVVLCVVVVEFYVVVVWC